MKHIWPIAMREIKERRSVFAVALALGLVAPLAGLLRDIEGLVVGLVFAVGLGHAVALLVGATTVNRPLREGRLGFFFNRPVGEGSLWWGKVLGTLLLAASVQVLAFLPSLIGALLRGRDVATELSILGASLVGLLGSVLAGHVFGTMVGSRTRAGAVDLLALLACFGIVWISWSRLSVLFASTAQFVLLGLVALLGLVGALVGGWRQVSLGRVEGSRSHRALSISVWSATLLAALLGFGFTSWVRDVHPAEMRMQGLHFGSSDSPWFVTHHAYLGQEVRHNVASQFLVHAETGAWEPLALGHAGRLKGQIADDGSRVAWSGVSGRCFAEGWVAENEDGVPKHRRRLPVDVCGADAWLLSAKGDRVADLAFVEDPARPNVNVRFRVWDVQTGRSEMETWLPVRRLRNDWVPFHALFWDSDGSLRLFVDDGWDLHLWRLEPSVEKVTKLATLAIGNGERRPSRTFHGRHYGGAAEIRFSRDGQQVLVGTVADGGVQMISSPRPLLADSREEDHSESDEGEPVQRRMARVATVSLAVWDAELQRPLFALEPLRALPWTVGLRGDHVSVTSRDENGATALRIGDANGWTYELPGHRVRGSFADGSLELVDREANAFSVDLATGELRDLPSELGELRGDGYYRLTPPLGSPWTDAEDARPEAIYASWGGLEERSSLVWVDLRTGDLRPFFAEKKSSATQ
ncbi:MAG: hypothetical protein AAF690_22070 [Acidobacteriota bacterium]